MLIEPITIDAICSNKKEALDQRIHSGPPELAKNCNKTNPETPPPTTPIESIATPQPSCPSPQRSRRQKPLPTISIAAYTNVKPTINSNGGK